MGIFDFIKKQFIDVVEWTEETDGVLSWRYPFEDREIQNGARLVVRETQKALFVDEGRMADLFVPGTYKLTTNTLPILTNLRNWDKFFQSPFKSDVYYFSTREQIDQKWGTPTPITIRDKEFGPIRIRAYGTFSYKIEDPKLFHQKLSGTREIYTTENLAGQLSSTIVTGLTNFFGNSTVGFVDMAANQTKFSETSAATVAPELSKFGLSLASFFVQSISLPEELQQKFDQLSSMNMLGDLRRYAQFQTASSIPIAAANEGGIAGAGAGLGAGMAIGQTMAGAMGMGMGNNGGAAAEDPLVTIEKLHQLMTKGAITKTEFESKKAELLKRVTG